MDSTGDVNRRKERLHLMFCCSASDETGGLGLGKKRQKESLRAACHCMGALYHQCTYELFFQI